MTLFHHDLTVIANQAALTCDFRIIRNDHAAFASRDVLRLLKAEYTSLTECTDPLPAQLGAWCLGAVFNHLEVISFGNSANLPHIAYVAQKMDRKNGARAGCDCPFNLFWIDAEGPRINVHEDWKSIEDEYGRR